MNLPPIVRQYLVPILATIIGLVSVTVAITSGTDDNGKPLRTVTIKVDGPDHDAKPDDPVVLTPPARQVEAKLKTQPNDINGPLTGRENTAALSGPVIGPVAKLKPPFASDSVAGCRTRTLRTNWSSRTVPQSRVILLWLHYTGGPDRPNSRADVDGLTAYGNNSAARVSWHINMDKDGNCDYNVPFRYKAWTESNANSTGIGIEVAGTGTAPYLRAGGIAQMRRIIADIHRSYPGITIRLGGVSACSPTKGGIVTHWMGGPCSGGHDDIHPLSITAVIALLKAGAPKPVPHRYAAWCREYAHYKRMANADRKDGQHRLSAKARVRSVKVRNALAGAHYSCSLAGVARHK
jgi:hypothetical protein